MKYQLKVQNIGGFDINLTENISNVIAVSHEFNIEDASLLEKRGKLFLVIHIEAINKFDLKQIVKVFVDTLEEEYYRPNDNTPLHAIEKSLNKALKTILAIKSKDETISLSSVESGFKCSFATAIIWNSILYTSYYGNAATYLIRGTGVRDLGLQNAYNDIWTSSSIIADNDVIIIGTSKFAELFSPKTITAHLGNLTNTIENSPEKDFIATILIKVSAENLEKQESFTDKIKNIEFKNIVSQNIITLKSKIIKPQKLHEQLEPHKVNKTVPVSSINSLVSHNYQSKVITDKPKPKRLSKVRGNSRKKSAILLGLIILVSIIYANYKLFYGNTDKQSDNQELIINNNTEKTNQVEQTANNDINHELFVNLDHVDKDVLFIDYTAPKDDNNYLYLISPKKIYKLNNETKEAEAIYTKLNSAKHLSCNKVGAKDLCFIYDNGTLLVLNVNDTSKTDKYVIDKSDILAIDSYNSDVYFLQKDNILKLKLGTNDIKKWLYDTQTLKNAIDFSTDGTSIFVISNRNILKYTNGKQAKNFKVNNSYLLKPIQVITNGKYIYVLDALDDSDKNIVIYNKTTGKFVKKIKLADKTDLEIPNKFTIINNKNEDIIFKKGNFLYKVKQT